MIEAATTAQQFIAGRQRKDIDDDRMLLSALELDTVSPEFFALELDTVSPEFLQ